MCIIYGIYDNLKYFMYEHFFPNDSISQHVKKTQKTEEKKNSKAVLCYDRLFSL